jgi:serine/threonine protein kinase
MSTHDPRPEEAATVIVSRPQPVAPAEAVDESAPTTLMPGRGRDAGATGSVDEAAATVVFDPADAPTMRVERGEQESDISLDATVVVSSSGQQPPVDPAQTAVSITPGFAPSGPKETEVSVPASPSIRSRGPGTAASSARTASSALGRSELPEVGEIVKDRFELVEELGRGGMGAVFRARDMRKIEALDPDPYVAIKFISGALIGFDLAFVALQREAKNAQRLNHPNIVKVFDFDRDGPMVFLTMEIVHGEPLNRRVRELPTKPMSDAERAHIAHGMLAGMAYAHARDVSHADLKPSNMMLDANGELKILDFGIARRSEYDNVFDADDLFALTIDYASPEMLERKRPTPADDVYALGCIIYALHTGGHPFSHVRADQARADKMRPVRPANATRVQWEALRKALAFTREERFADAGQFLRAYEGRDWRKIGGIGSVVLAVCLGVAWFAADPIQSWMTTSALPVEQKQALERSLQDGSEYLAGGYAEDALYAFAEVLTLDMHNAKARGGARAALKELQGKMPADQYRGYLQLQLQDAKSPAWLRELVESEIAKLSG